MAHSAPQGSAASLIWPTRPNAFVAIQISLPTIRRKLKQVQDSMCSYNEQLEEFLTSIKKLHITLMVIRMDTDEDIKRGIESLDAASEIIKSEFNGFPLELNVTGISSFGSKVVFANVTSETEQNLQRIARIVHKVFEDNSLRSTDNQEKFTPHATIAKASTCKSWGRNSIPRESYSQYVNDQFGIEIVTNIELLSMTEPEQDNGYYHCFQKSQFSEYS